MCGHSASSAQSLGIIKYRIIPDWRRVQRVRLEQFAPLSGFPRTKYQRFLWIYGENNAKSVRLLSGIC